jgi:hypothetical protein
MDFKPRHARPQKSRKVSNLPTPEMDDPTEIFENNTASFVDDNELKYLLREKARMKLRKAQVEDTDGKLDIVIPECSDLESQTRVFLKKLEELARQKTKTSYMELEILQKTFNTKSLLNIATALARMRLREQETEKLKYWYSGLSTGFLVSSPEDFGEFRYRIPDESNPRAFEG